MNVKEGQEVFDVDDLSNDDLLQVSNQEVSRHASKATGHDPPQSDCKSPGCMPGDDVYLRRLTLNCRTLSPHEVRDHLDRKLRQG